MFHNNQAICTHYIADIFSLSRAQIFYINIIIIVFATSLSLFVWTFSVSSLASSAGRRSRDFFSRSRYLAIANPEAI